MYLLQNAGESLQAIQVSKELKVIYVISWDNTTHILTLFFHYSTRTREFTVMILLDNKKMFTVYLWQTMMTTLIKF